MAAYRTYFILLTFLLGTVLWFLPAPQGLSEQAWHLLAIFIATIFSIMTRPIPMGASALLSLSAVLLTKTLPFEDAFSGFTNSAVWLVVTAYFVARGFTKTKLGLRVSYFFIQLFGRHPIGLGYGLLTTDLLLAPAIPSNTARSGGIVLPILESLIEIFDGKSSSTPKSKIGSYLSLVSAQASVTTSAMFLTAMSANPLIVGFASAEGVQITWTSWALAASLPGLCSLILIPIVLFILSPPALASTKEAAKHAQKKLQEMGPVRKPEYIMIGVFILLLILWINAEAFSIKPTVSALFGVVLLLLTEVLSWEDIRSESAAWETLIWFAVLVMLATKLCALGFTTWLASNLSIQVAGLSWHIGFIFLALMYFYSHYFFASLLAHITAMYATFLAVAIAIGTPPMLAALTFAFFSNLFGSLTQYTSGPAALLFGLGFVELKSWWKINFFMSVIQIILWLGLGSLWWHFLGYW